ALRYALGCTRSGDHRAPVRGMGRESIDHRRSISPGRVPASCAHGMPLHRALGPHLQGGLRRVGRYPFRPGGSRPRATRWRRHRVAQGVAQERVQRAGIDSQRARLGRRPDQGARPRRRRLHAQAVQPRRVARAHPLAGPAAVYRQADRARARRHPPRSARSYGAGQRQAGRSHQPRICSAGDLHAKPRAHPSPHPDHRQDLGLELRRRHQPARCLHEPAARQAGDDLGQDPLQDRARGRISTAMKSIGTRIAAWYATAATATLACLFVVGYLLLEKQLVHGLDLLIETEFRQIETRLGPDYRTLSPQAIETRIREITDYASTLFYIDMHIPGKGVIFRSTNLIGHDIPDVPGARRYTIEVPDVHDEISDLARLLNEMFDRLEVSFHQVRRFTADASHELKIPLSLISLHAEKMLVDGNLPPAQREAVQVQLEEIARLNRIIDELLFLSKADARAAKLDLRPQSPAPLVRAVAQDA